MKNKVINQFKVSVIIPFYNEVEWLCEAVESVRNQTFKNIEIIVINDGSSENTNEFLKKYGKHIVYKYKENEGPGPTRNLGIEIANGDYIAFLDSDDIWLPNKLEIQLSIMEKNDFAWSYTGYETFGEKKRKIRIPGIMKGNIYPYILDSSNIGTPTVIVKSEIFKDNPNLRFSNTMRYSQDYYLWVNLALFYEVGTIDTVLCKVRMRGTNAEKSIYKHMVARNKIWSVVRSDKKLYKYKSISRITKIGYSINNYCLKIIDSLPFNKLIKESLAKMFYLLPIMIFKLHQRTKK